MLQNVSVGNGEVDSWCGKFEILRAGCNVFCRGLASWRRILSQPHSIDGVNILKLVLAREVEDQAPGIALHGLRSGLLDAHVTGQGGGAKQVLFASEQKLRLIGSAAHF